SRSVGSRTRGRRTCLRRAACQRTGGTAAPESRLGTLPKLPAAAGQGKDCAEHGRLPRRKGRAECGTHGTPGTSGNPPETDRPGGPGGDCPRPPALRLWGDERMSRKTLKGVAVVSLAAVAGLGGGYWLAQHNQPAVAQASAMAANVQQERKVLYWYDPMSPQQKFDKPGKSPFMDMDLVPRYADESGATAAVSIDPGVSQNLGVRVARVELGKLDLYVE